MQSNWLTRFFCWIGCHHWDQPGGHCIDCGACDEFFGPHNHDKVWQELTNVEVVDRMTIRYG